jgi:amino acid transporter
MQTSILSVIPWQEAQNSPFLVSLFVERTFGLNWAALGTGLILVLAFGSIFSATLGYSRVPYAAALDGNFFSIFARVHPTKHFPYISLIALGLTSAIICLFFDLFSVIRAILAMRCLIQFVGQACGLMLLHRKWKAERWPFRMWLYPVPVLLAIAGWLGIFLSTGLRPIISSLGAMTVGLLVYMGRARMLGQWPFEQTDVAS